jgi:hypothetical protein
MQLFVMEFSPVSCCFLLLMSKYLPQHSVLEYPQPISLTLSNLTENIARVHYKSRLIFVLREVINDDFEKRV